MSPLTIKTGMLLALLPVALGLVLVPLGVINQPASLARIADLLSGAMLLLGCCRLLYQPTQPLRLLGSLLAVLLPLALLTGILQVASATAVMLCGTLLSMLLLPRLYHNLRAAPRSGAQGAGNPAGMPDRSAFLTRLSHETRTPLNGVLGMTELLLATPLSPRQRDYVQTLQGAGNDLLQRLNELFDISALANGMLELEVVAFDLHALVQECVNNFLITSAHDRNYLHWRIASDVPGICHGDPNRLRQILCHLLDNAHRRSGSLGHIELEVSALARSPLLHISVSDNAPALPEAERRLLLETPLTDEVCNENYSSQQIGLIVSHQLSRLMKGHFGLESPVEGGLSSWVTLPLLEQQTQPAARLPLKLSDAHVLVVDANPTSRALLVQQCASWGLQVQESTSADEALALVRTQWSINTPFDTLLIDQDLPDGALSLAQRIRADLSLPQELLLLLCGNGPGTLAARNAGFNRVLGRPLAAYTLRATLEEELARLFAARRGPADKPPQLPDNCRILVAEDDSISAKVIRGLLAKLNLEPEVVSNGQQALEAMARAQYDLVLMDCDMPVLDGFEATRRQRIRERDQQLPHQPIVALSAHVMEAQRRRMEAAGMDDQLAKPVELLQLYRILERWIQLHAQHPGHNTASLRSHS